MKNENKKEVIEEISTLEREIETMNYQCMLREEEISKLRERLMRTALLAETTLLKEGQRLSIESEMSDLEKGLQALDREAKDVRASIDKNGTRLSHIRIEYEKKKKLS